MLVVLHVFIALLSLGYTGFLFARPSKNRIRMAYGLAVATIVSGTYLVISTHQPMLASCEAGLVYLLAVIPAIAFASRKLAKSTD
jgi:hypothetical protein